MPYSLVLHANIQYAEIPESELEKVYSKSYKPVIEMLVKKEIPFCLNITGYSLERIPREIIDLIRDGVSSGTIQLSGTSYSHAILPLLPLDRVYEQVKKDIDVKKELFDFREEVFWPPELAYDPLLPGILRMFNYSHVFIDGEAVVLSEKYMNTYFGSPEPSLKHLYLAEKGKGSILMNYLKGLKELKKALENVFEGKIVVRGVEEIIGIPIWVPVNVLTILSIGEYPFMSIRKGVKMIKKIHDIVIYGTDIEFYGYRPIGKKPLSINNLIKFISRLKEDFVHPTRLPLKNKNKVYLKTSSWAPDKSLDIWRIDPDNRRLNMFLGWVKGVDAWVLENSDSRGWIPLPEKRLSAYKAIFNYWLKVKDHGD